MLVASPARDNEMVSSNLQLEADMLKGGRDMGGFRRLELIFLDISGKALFLAHSGYG